jgi:glyoxylate reductase
LFIKFFTYLFDEQSRKLKVQVTTIPDVLNKDLLSQAKYLKVISNFAIGLDNIDVVFARSKGIAVYNLPDIVTNSTADLTFAILLALIRKIPQAQEFVKEGRWKGWEPALFLGEELSGKTFGIIGYGRIGKAVAKRALGFGLNIVVYNRSQIVPEEPILGSLKQVSWDEFLSLSDYISIHVPLTEETKSLINMQILLKMKKKPILINMARGAIIETDDLVVALEKGLLRGAALDVTYPEPLSNCHPLCMLENCLITPHIGSATVECRERMAKQAAMHIIEHFQKNS